MVQANLTPTGNERRARPLVFGPDYLEPITLRDGRPARIVALRPEHADIVTAGFAKLSDRTRYLRFFGPKRCAERGGNAAPAHPGR